MNIAACFDVADDGLMGEQPRVAVVLSHPSVFPRSPASSTSERDTTASPAMSVSPQEHDDAAVLLLLGHASPTGAMTLSPTLAALDPAFGAEVELLDGQGDEEDDDDRTEPAASRVTSLHGAARRLCDPDDELFDARRAAAATPPPLHEANHQRRKRSVAILLDDSGDAFPPHARRLAAEDRFVACEAHEDDAEAIIALTRRVNMNGATSFVWPAEELRERIARRAPLVVVATELAQQHEDAALIVGVAGIDTSGMEKPFPVLSIGSRATKTAAGEVFFIPDSYCMCRGLLIDENFQGCGLGSLLHKTRINLLRQIAPDTPSVVLSARGSSYGEARAILGPVLSIPHDVTPELQKSDVLEFTFPSSKGVVHLAHGKQDEGWKFIGVDTSDGGPVWMTTLELAALTRSYSHLGSFPRLASLRRASTSSASNALAAPEFSHPQPAAPPKNSVSPADLPSAG